MDKLELNKSLVNNKVIIKVKSKREREKKKEWPIGQLSGCNNSSNQNDDNCVCV